jgi:PAN domain
MTLQAMSFIFGALLLAVAILGGGFEIKGIKVPNVTSSVRIIAGIVGIIFVGLSFWQPTELPETARGDVKMSQREDGKDRLGGDYSNFNVKTDHIEDCENACKGDKKCVAWTYVKPGYKGPQAECFLKNVVPAMSDNPNCVSGRKLP